MNEYEKAIAEARMAHEMQQQLPSMSMVGQVPMSRHTKVKHNNVDLARVELIRSMSPEQRHRIVYIPLLIKSMSFMLMDNVCDILKRSNIAKTKRYSREFKANYAEWIHDLHAPDMPAGSEEHVFRMMWRWWDDSMKEVLNSIHYANVQQVMRDFPLAGNEADLVGWVLTMRDCIEQCIAYDDESMSLLQDLTTCNIVRNQHDGAYRIKRYCNSLIRTILGKDYQTSAPTIVTGRKVIRNKMVSMDIISYLVEDNAQEEMRLSNHECEYNRCRDCDCYPCKRYKTVLRQYKNEQ